MPLKKLVPGWKKREEKREEEREKKRAFLKNGGLVLEKLVASCNGRPIPIRTFSYQQLILVTNSFDPRLLLHEDWQYKIYKGSFEGRILSINMNVANKYTTASEVLTNMGISAKMSAHKNVLKLVGCSLETSFPTLVFEYAQNGVLSDRIYTSRRPGTPMVWQSRLKIARQIAHTIAYIYTAFSRPIIHRDIKPVNIFLDQHDVPKLTNFSLSVTIPEGETQVEESVCGTFGYLCPSYARTGTVIEKTDVYSFGIVLLELLTGRRLSDFAEDYNSEDFNAEDFNAEDFSAEDVSTKDIDLPSFAKNHAINEIVDSAILAEEGGAGVEQQLEAVRQLGLTCVEFNPEIRPTMVDVTKELRRIERSIT